MGEKLEERESKKTESVVEEQIRGAFEGINEKQIEKLVIAYEPVWAIGTGKAATPQDANKVILESIRSVLSEAFGDGVSELIRILYGGSVKPENAKEFFSESEIDGALVGGASLKAESFVGIVKAACP